MCDLAGAGISLTRICLGWNADSHERYAPLARCSVGQEIADPQSRVVPPSQNATLDGIMHFEFSMDILVKVGVGPTKNGMCYIYE